MVSMFSLKVGRVVGNYLEPPRTFTPNPRGIDWLAGDKKDDEPSWREKPIAAT